MRAVSRGPFQEGRFASTNPSGVRWDRWSTEMHLLVTEASALARARVIVEAELDAVELAATLSAGFRGQRADDRQRAPTPVSPVQPF